MTKQRYIPKGGNGGDRRSGKASKIQQLAERQAALTGKLSHILLLEWAQTGVMEQVEYEVKRSKKKGGGVRLIAKRDKNGEFIRESVVLDPFLRIDAAKASANYFAAKRREQENHKIGFDDDLKRMITVSAERVRSRLMLALPAPLVPETK